MSENSIYSGEMYKYNTNVNRIIVSITRYIPLLVLAYGFFIEIGVVPGSDFYTLPSLLMLVGLLYVLYLVSKHQLQHSLAFKLCYYLLFLTLAVFVVGMQATIIYWIPLSVSTVLQYGKKVYFSTFILLAAFTALDNILHYPVLGFDYVLSNSVRMAFIAISSYIVVAIILGIMKDRFQLLRAKQREDTEYARVLTLINSLNDAVFSINNNGKVKLYNAASLNLLDTNASLNNKHIDEVFTLKDTKGKNVSLLDFVKSAKKLSMREDLFFHYSQEEKVRLSIVAAPIHASFNKTGATTNGFIFIVKDITKSKSLEEERDEFISVISHELRTPITITEASISNMQLLAEKDNASMAIKKGLGDAHEQVLYLAKMINDLSALSRAEQTGDDKSEAIDVHDLCNKLYHKYLPEARANQLVLNLDITPNLPEITTNKLYLEEIIQNLITNAIKYTKKGSVTLKVDKNDVGVVFSVIDTGIGIAKSEKEKIFDKFYRSEDYRTRQTGGTGLGLYVSRKLASKLHTRIVINSRLSHGSTFSFTIKKK